MIEPLSHYLLSSELDGRTLDRVLCRLRFFFWRARCDAAGLLASPWDDKQFELVDRLTAHGPAIDAHLIGLAELAGLAVGDDR
jgi:hypothetical protein